MPLAIPPELKKVTPFIRRAEELDRDRQNPESRLVAYYCRQYAVSAGIPLADAPESKQCLTNMLENLEEEKEPMSNFTREEARFLCRKFADTIFDKADGEDRLGMASKTTAKTFYAAATFYEILDQFYEKGAEATGEQQEEKERLVYSKWKATEILKAIKEGRQPTPGGYGETEEEEPEDIIPPAPVSIPAPMTTPVQTVDEEEEEESADEETSIEGAEDGLGPPPVYPGKSPASSAEGFLPEDPPSPAPSNRPPIKPVVPPPPPVAPVSKPSGFFGMGKKKGPAGKVSKAQLADAVELTQFALSALKNKDIEIGAARLREALAALGQ